MDMQTNDFLISNDDDDDEDGSPTQSILNNIYQSEEVHTFPFIFIYD